MGETAIEWTDVTKNPIRARRKGSTATKGGYNSGVGHYCEKVSKGCKNCYASALQPRFGLPQFQEQRGEDAPDVFLDVNVLLSVLRMREGKRIFWCDMTDLFGSWVPFEWVCTILAVMAATPQHTHQILTKRPERALAFFAWLGDVEVAGGGYPLQVDVLRDYARRQGVEVEIEDFEWPLPNVHFGVSVESQDETSRLDDLMRIPAAVRWASLEPLVGPVNVARYMRRWCDKCDGEIPVGANACVVDIMGGTCGGAVAKGSLDWGVVGLESGPKARPGDVRWVRHLKLQFERAGVPVFIKQLGANTRDVNDGRLAPNAEEDGVPGAWPNAMSDRWLDSIERNPDRDGDLGYQGEPVRVRLRSKKGGDPAEWPRDLRVRMHVGDKWPT